MAAKGSVLKKEVAEKILAAFPGSFLYNDGKEIRINGLEDGQSLQIKVTLTCAKVAVEGGDDTILPGEKPVSSVASTGVNEKIPQEPTQEEKDRLTALLDKMGLK
jgi:hypothetical protein